MSRDGLRVVNTRGFAPDKRKEPRRSADGEVSFVIEDSSAEIRAHLVDISASGFRASHQHQDLRHGQVVEFRHPVAAGRARVMWNRIAGGKVETGFLVI
jgi:CelD/BcsL family acetyltransferase involved in cellulose biosynthesis